MFSTSKAEDSLAVLPKLQNNVGFGIGLDYGGIGGRLTYCPDVNFGLFVSAGFVLIGFGVNGGALVKLAPKEKVCPYFGVMYGYNALIKIVNASEYNQIYYGPSLKIGVEFWTRRKQSFFDIGLILPKRSQDYFDDLNKVKTNPAITMKSEPRSALVSLGLNFGF